MSYLRFPLVKQSQLLLLYSDSFVQRHADFFFPKLRAAWMVHIQHTGGDIRCLDSVVNGADQQFFCLTHHPPKPCFQNKTPAPSMQTQFASTSSQNCNNKVQSNKSESHRESKCCHLIKGTKSLVRRNSDTNIFFPTSGNKIDFLQKLSLVYCPSTCLSGPSQSAEKKEGLDWSRGGLASCLCYGGVTRHDCTAKCCMVPGSSRSDVCYFTPRNYTCDDWSTCLTIEEFTQFPRYASHTYFFSTPASALHTHPSSHKPSHEGPQACSSTSETENEDGSVFEWQVELYPKGVRFPAAKMIGIPYNFDIEETSHDVVRLSLSCKSPHVQVR